MGTVRYIQTMPDELPRRPLYKRLNTVRSRVLLSVLYLTLEVFESTTLQAIGCRLQNTVFEPSDDQKTGEGPGGDGGIYSNCTPTSGGIQVFRHFFS